jgi:general secretion pathway protein A
VREIFRQSQGIPRLINVIADRALLAAYTQDTRTIDARLVRRAATEVFGKERRVGWRAHLAALATVAGLAGIGYATIYHTTPRLPAPAPIEQATLEADDPADDAVRFPVDAVAEPVIPPDGNGVATEPAEMPAEDTAVAANELAAAPRPTMAELLADPGVPKDTDSAFVSLFSLWGADYESGTGFACGQAQQQGLRCWYQKGTLSHLRRLNRPAILSLLDANGDEYQLVLSGVGETSATLLAGGISYKIDFEDLAEFWYGDQLILWKPGYDGPSSIGPGDEGDGVLWLRESFAKIDGEPPPLNASRFYDSALEARVRAYQRDNRLGVDGIVGIQTQVVINTDLGVPGTPLLTGAQ